ELRDGVLGRDERERPLHVDVRGRLCARRARRRARRRHPLARAVLRAQIRGAVPGGGDRRRRGQLQGLVRRRHGARHHRHARQVFRHASGALSPLRRGVRAPAVAAPGPPPAETRGLMTTPSPPPPQPPPATGLGALAITSPLSLVGHALPWAIAIAFFFVAEGYLSLGTQIMIWILFALSLDLALGYAGIVTLGHAAFFGFGAYAAGLFAIHVSHDPLLGHLAAIVLTALLGLITGALILHTTGVTFLMLTLAIVSIIYEYANQARDLTGGDDGLQGIKIDPIFGVFEFNIFGQTAYVYSLVVLFAWFLIAWRIVHSPFGRSLDGIRQNPRRMRAI